MDQAGAGWLACPDCGTHLETLERLEKCPGCARAFEAQDGTPSLFPTLARKVSFDLAPSAFDPTQIPRERIYRYPPRSGQEGSGAYHLDRAHADVLEAMPKGSLILETGCGGAQMRGWARERGLGYIGTDVSKARVHGWLQEFGGADLLCDAHALPVRDASVDAVYVVAVWEHLAFPALAAQEAARVLKPGGWHLGSVSFLEPWHDESYTHMTPHGVTFALRAAGLEPVHVWPEIAWPGFVAILKMGNKATRPVSVLGRLMNGVYLMPKKIQLALRNRRWPGPDALYDARAQVSGAIAWIARKPGDQGESGP